MRVCGHSLHVRLHLVRGDEGVVQPALQHVLELGAVGILFALRDDSQELLKPDFVDELF